MEKGELVPKAAWYPALKVWSARSSRDENNVRFLGGTTCRNMQKYSGLLLKKLPSCTESDRENIYKM